MYIMSKKWFLNLWPFVDAGPDIALTPALFRSVIFNAVLSVFVY